MSFTVGQEVEVVDENCLTNLRYNNLPNTGVVVEGFSYTPKDTTLVEFISDKGKLKLAFYPDQLKLANTFNSQKEIWEYLLDGGKVLSKETKYVYQIDGEKVSIVNMPNSIKSVDCNFRVFTNFTKYTEPAKWYDNIPKSGILCWVNDLNGIHSKDHKCQIVLGYTTQGSRPFHTKHCYWEYATPVTQEEVNKLIYQQQ